MDCTQLFGVASQIPEDETGSTDDDQDMDDSEFLLSIFP